MDVREADRDILATMIHWLMAGEKIHLLTWENAYQGSFKIYDKEELAAELGLRWDTLQRKMKKLGIWCIPERGCPVNDRIYYFPTDPNMYNNNIKDNNQSKELNYLGQKNNSFNLNHFSDNPFLSDYNKQSYQYPNHQVLANSSSTNINHVLPPPNQNSLILPPIHNVMPQISYSLPPPPSTNLIPSNVGHVLSNNPMWINQHQNNYFSQQNPILIPPPPKSNSNLFSILSETEKNEKTIQVEKNNNKQPQLEPKKLNYIFIQITS